MITVVCVYWKGTFKGRSNIYSEDDVRILKKMVEINLTIPHRFVCLSNVLISGIETISLKHNWSGWWSKIELFRPGLFEGRVLYFDLDTVILSKIDALLLQEFNFIGLSPFNAVRRNIKGYIASGIMSWVADGTFDFIYNRFDYELDSKKEMGDQEYINYVLQSEEVYPERWQDLVDGIYSYKRHVRYRKHKLNPRIVCFHGSPRPSEVNINWNEV